MLIEEIFGIHFEIIPNITVDIVKEKFEKVFKYIKKELINYIEIGELDEIYIYINKEGEPETEWNYSTLQILDLLNIFGFDAFLSEQDYGYIDVIVINEWM